MIFSRYSWLTILIIWKCLYSHVTLVDSYSSSKTVELAVFIDQYLYHYWYTLLKRSPARSFGSFPSSTLSMHRFIRSYLEVLLDSLNLIYAHPSLASFSSSPLQEVPHIRFHLAHTDIFWRRGVVLGNPSLYSSSASFQARKNLVETISAAPLYLETFCDFANKENWNGNRWDHALLLTGVDLKFPNGTNYSVAGISWDNSMCNKTYSCSVIEGKTFRSVMTAVHEIAHSLGVEHDGHKHNFKCPSTGYIMSHAGGGGGNENDPVGKIAWSPCSKHNLKAFLATAPNILSNQVACLNNKPKIDVKDVLKPPHYIQRTRDSKLYGVNNRGRTLYVRYLNTLPGKRFSAVEQCRLGGGEKWRPSGRRVHMKKLCSMLYCNNTHTGELVPFHPALEGTVCARNKVCQYGECVFV